MKKEQQLDLYYQMVLIRRFEEKSGQMYGLRKIGGFCHLYSGQTTVELAFGEKQNIFL